MPVRKCWWAFKLVSLLVVTASVFTLSAFAASVFVASVFVASVRAQSAATAVLLPPQTESFPRIHAYLDVHNAQGDFLRGIQAEQVSILENGRSLPVVEFEELRPGVQIVFALSPGESFSIRNSQGVSRYDFVRDALIGWADGRQGSTLDDLSLMVTGGPELTHFTDSIEIVTALQGYQPDMGASTPGLDILLRAIDLAADATPRPGMERAVLLITAPPLGDINFGMQELVSRATELHVRIYIWLVASPESFTNQQTTLLARMAEQTGGQIFTFSGEQALPSLELYFEKLRDIYSIAYDSQIKSGGEHQLGVEIQADDQLITADPIRFQFDLQPPAPAFLSPSPEVQRVVPPGFYTPWQPADQDDLVPRQQVLRVLVEFPDGRNRPLVRSALFVDGLMVDENTQPPFEQFTWDLSRYTIDGQHLVQVEVIDSLGMRGASIMMPVLLDVDLPKPNPLSGLVRRWPLLALLVVVLFGVLALLVLILSERISPRLAAQLGFRKVKLPRWRRTTAGQPQPERSKADVGGRGLPVWVNRLQWPQRRLNPKAYAFLSPLTESRGKTLTAPISIAMDELTFGLDPNQATMILDDPSIDGLHARLLRCADGSFRLVDEGSVAGTWVNYLPVNGEGHILQHGDLVHFGRLGFRFTQREPGPVNKPVIICSPVPLEDEMDYSKPSGGPRA